MEPLLITTVQGNFGFDWNFTLTDSQGVVLNLNGATLTFELQSVSDLSVSSANAMSIINASAGTCKYTVQQNDFLVAGNYNAQIKVTFGTGEIFTFSDITIVVEASVPISQNIGG